MTINNWVLSIFGGWLIFFGYSLGKWTLAIQDGIIQLLGMLFTLFLFMAGINLVVMGIAREMHEENMGDDTL